MNLSDQLHLEQELDRLWAACRKLLDWLVLLTIWNILLTAGSVILVLHVLGVIK